MKNGGVKSILILGATGFVGKPLTRALAGRGHRVTCLVRNLDKASRSLPNEVRLIKGDVLNRDDILAAAENIEIIYYLVHSIPSGEKTFEKLDIEAAENVVAAARTHRVKRIIYLGGLGKRDLKTSAHLKSRHDVGKILRTGGCKITEFRAAVIAGKGGLSYEMIHHLANRLPVMICPVWVYTKTQPIAIPDVVRYLEDCPAIPETEGKIIDIGGPDILSYRDMMLMMARAMGLKRYLIKVPVLTPRLSSYWVDLVTPIQASYARTLIEGLRYETVRENYIADELFDFKPMGFQEMVRQYPGSLKAGNSPAPLLNSIDDSHIFRYRTSRKTTGSVSKLFETLTKIGGDNGWFYANWLWKLRGFIDKLFGGIGYRKGRDDKNEIKAGDRIDFWRVEQCEQNRLIRLRAEMKIFGHGWLEFRTAATGASGSDLKITAYYYPRGLLGYLYWFLSYPVHILIFEGMAGVIARKATEG